MAKLSNDIEKQKVTGKSRCSWGDATPELLHYHDNEWGIPVGSDQKLFEKLCLETFQSGLSWRTILAKRENFRRAFHDFDIDKVAQFDEADIERLLADTGIIRNKRKIKAVINNAKRAQEIIREVDSFEVEITVNKKNHHGKGSNKKEKLAAFLWHYEPDENTLPPPETTTTSNASIALSKELKRRGWQFLGPTTLHAFMQSMGLINDHAEHCYMREKIDQARKQFQRP